jgi:hypothetical protein
MSLSGIFNLLQQYAGAGASSATADTQHDFDKVAQTADQSHLAGGLAEAFRSGQTPPFPEMVKSLFSQSNDQQRAGLINQLLSGSGSGVGALLSGGLASVLGGRTQVSPQEAGQVSPEDVQQLAEQAHKSNPSIVDSVSEFYSQHPTLVKTLGGGALALVMAHMYENHS